MRHRTSSTRSRQPACGDVKLILAQVNMPRVVICTFIAASCTSQLVIPAIDAKQQERRLRSFPFYVCRSDELGCHLWRHENAVEHYNLHLVLCCKRVDLRWARVRPVLGKLSVMRCDEGYKC